jgi:hypothetical protein
MPHKFKIRSYCPTCISPIRSYDNRCFHCLRPHTHSRFLTSDNGDYNYSDNDNKSDKNSDKHNWVEWNRMAWQLDSFVIVVSGERVHCHFV